MNISNFFIKRPIFAGVISIIIFVIGAIAYFRLPLSEYPEVVPPTVVVRTSYPGANPTVIADTVASPPSLSGSAPTSTKRKYRCRTAFRRRCRGCRRKSSASA